MKRTITRTIIAAMASLALLPQAAHADEVVEFEYSPRELTTVEARDALLLRLNAKVQNACSAGKLAPYHNKADCHRDVQGQLIDAIGSSALSAQSRSDETELASARP